MLPTVQLSLICVLLLLWSDGSSAISSIDPDWSGEGRCQQINIPQCKDIGYNMTRMPNLMGHNDQIEAAIKLQEFATLIQFGCHSHLKFFLCSLYAPMCTEQVSNPIPACRVMCEQVKLKCSPILEHFKFPWPDSLDCSRLPTKNDPNNLCMEAPNNGSDEPPKVSHTQPPDFRPQRPLSGQDLQLKDSGSKQTCSNPGKFHFVEKSESCAPKCYPKVDVYWSQGDKQFSLVWMAIWSILCFVSSAFTVLTFLIDPQRFKYPERPIIFLSMSYCVYSVGYLIRLFVGADRIACDRDNGVQYIIQEGLESTGCTIVFLILYYFGMASSLWWVILTLTWFLAAGKNQAQESAPAAAPPRESELHEEALGSARSFDGALLFLPHRLHSKETVLHSETRNGEKVRITVTLTNELPPTSPMCIQFYNIIFRRVLRILNMQQIGRNYYNPKDPLDIPVHKLTIWPGYSTTILQYESSIMLSIDMSHRVLRSETVLDFMANIRHQVGNQRFPDICAKELIGLIVLTKYNNKTYRIDDIAWDHTPKNTFTRRDTEVSFKDYYKNQYGVDITDDNQVLLVSHVKRLGPAGAPPPGPAMLIPELCYLTGLTQKMRADFTIMKALSEHTKLSPEAREGGVSRFINNIRRNADAQAELDKWGLNFDSKLLNLTGRVLPRERLFQGSRSYDYGPDDASWSRQMRGMPLISSPPLDNWIMFYTRRCSNEAQSLLQTLKTVSGPLGIRVKNPLMIEYEDHQESLLRALKQNVGPQTQILVVILPTDRKDKYDTVKRFLCVECPTPSQCVVSRTLRRALMSVGTKIALQMACKMGGELWSLKHVMIVGIDCYHDTTAGKRSIGALVASLNQNMSSCLPGALKDYLKWNNCLPSRIIVYRDGVGDGQLHSVVNYEVSQIMDCIKSMGHDYMPKLSVVVVKKRISSRFFARINGKVTNPPPGTIIDSEVTRPEWYDFYIVSQSVQFGCVSPTHYNVVYDTSGLKPDHMQRLTYKLCHMYYNWQGVIRVPAPCQYAHKLAFLVGQSIHRQPNVQLDNLLFYL
ncbi:Piwi-like protein 1 [Nibea albiflora]|uniref:Piwi-like protein 1 n=1 Tax=Nibea albiflora TaxID=240163 RepID=A0ACB7FD87_NIBAL|nr:Piwi-like protein 1 [Nibea albiflora]